MQQIRSWADWEGLPDKTPAERALVEACRTGETCTLGDGTRPEAPSPERNIRAPLLRYLILGGCKDAPMHEHGVEVVGAWIHAPLTLDFARAKGKTALYNCRVVERINAQQTSFKVLDLQGSCMVQGIFAQGAKVAGSVHLREGFLSTGTIDLNSIKIGGHLDCQNANFVPTKGEAINAQTAEVAGAIFLHEKFKAFGTVDLNGAKAAVLSCIRATFDPGSGDNGRPVDQRRALRADRIRIRGRFFWREVKVVSGVIDLNSATVGDLCDDFDSWPHEAGRADIDGMTYKRFSGTFTDAKWRRDWLTNAAFYNDSFYPQPYVQCAKVLHDMGHEAEARSILIEMNRQLHNWSQRKNVDRMNYSRNLLRVETGPISGNPATPDTGFQIAGHLEHDVKIDSKLFRRLQIPLNAGSKERFPPTKTMGSSGHSETTRLYARRDFRRRIAIEGAHATFRLVFDGCWDRTLRYFVGYGYAPQRSLWWFAAIWLAAFLLSSAAWEAGDMAPNSGPILVSEDWQRISKTAENPGKQWSCDPGREDLAICPEGGRDWETFNRYAYAFDVVVPILNLGQTDAWAPSTSRGNWGWHLWWARWVLSTLGWVVTALAAAAVTGVIQKND